MKDKDKILFWDRVECLCKMMPAKILADILQAYGEKLSRFNPDQYDSQDPQDWLLAAREYLKPHKGSRFVLALSIACVICAAGYLACCLILDISPGHIGGTVSSVVLVAFGISGTIMWLRLASLRLAVHADELGRLVGFLADSLMVQVGGRDPIIVSADRVSLYILSRFDELRQLQDHVLACLAALRPRNALRYAPRSLDNLRDIEATEKEWNPVYREAFVRVHEGASAAGIIKPYTWRMELFPPG